LSPTEIDFFDRHQDYDRGYAAAYLVNWLVTALHGLSVHDREGRYALVRSYAAGRPPAGLPREAAAMISRHAPLAAVVSDFNRAFQRQSRQTPYPAEEIRKLSSAGPNEAGR
jgi:hypothetical protein